MRVFVVEDSATIRANLIETLKELFGAEIVGWAATESHAIKMLAKLDWDVALVDLFLASGSGLGVARALQGRDKARLVFVTTNYATPDMRSRCAALNVDAVFDKSVELDLLFDRLAILR